MRSIVAGFDEEEASRVKEIEDRTRHDVKAVEYYLRERLQETSLADVQEAVHFCCTSEDINNLAYALMLKEGIRSRMAAPGFSGSGCARWLTWQRLRATWPMLTRTHGQPATPSTMGKELAVFVYRWRRQLRQLEAADTWASSTAPWAATMPTPSPTR